MPSFQSTLPLKGYPLKNVDSANKSPVPFVLDTPVNCLYLFFLKMAEVPLLIIWFRHM